MLMMEVGALFVGKIENRPRRASVKRGEEKGNFAFGGSTIVLITEKNAVKPDEDILKNSQAGMETRVLMGEKIGESF
jgi:phosphatidylserine decarboxylase